MGFLNFFSCLILVVLRTCQPMYCFSIRKVQRIVHSEAWKRNAYAIKCNVHLRARALRENVRRVVALSTFGAGGWWLVVGYAASSHILLEGRRRKERADAGSCHLYPFHLSSDGSLSERGGCGLLAQFRACVHFANTYVLGLLDASMLWINPWEEAHGKLGTGKNRGPLREQRE